MLGTLVNVGTVLAGGALGLVVHNRLPESHRRIAFDGLGLVTLTLGAMMALRTHNPLVLILAVLAGGLLGQSLRLDTAVERGADSLKGRVASAGSHFSEGLITAFLLFCMGSMTIIGAMEEGMGRGSELLLAKAVMDGFAALALASTFGAGVLFSVVPLLVYQGAWTLVGVLLGEVLPVEVLDEISAVGGILLLGLGFELLEIRRIPLLNLLPALLFAILFALLALHLGL